MPQERDPDAPLVRLPRGSPLPPRFSKTGPRTVWLSQPARNVLDGLDRTGQWVFPAARGKGPRNKGWLEGFWDTVRAEAGLRGVRLHDLRHTHASIALRQGETVLTIAKLLGHRNPETTLKYTHLADKTVMDAAETVGAALDALTHGRQGTHAAHRYAPSPVSAPASGNTRSGIIIVVGLGVRVRPTGGRSYVLLEDTGGRSRRVSLGPVSLKTVAEVRQECHARKAEPEATGAPRRVAPLFRDFVEGAWKEAHFDGYKPSTRKGVQSLFERQLLPAFGSKPLDRIASADRAMVRPLQPDRSRQRQSRARPSHADHQFRHRPRPPRNQPGVGRGKEPETDAHALSVPRGDRSAPSRPGQADPRQQARAGRYHPAPASDRMPQERDPSAALVGSRSRQAGPCRRQDRAKDRSPQHSGPAHSRTPAARWKPVRLSVPERSRPGPAAATLRSGIAPGARLASRTFAFTTSGTRMPATQ